MAAWGTIFGCVGYGLLQHGLRALAGVAPGGSVIYEVCVAATGEWKKSVDRLEERQVIEQMLAKYREEIKAEVSYQITELKKLATPEQAEQLDNPKVAQGLELYLESIPDHLRASLRRPEDPSGNSVPDNFSLLEERGFAAILPNRTPRFRTGDAVGNYVLTEPLGLGGFGEVWKARHVRLSSRVAAIKFCLDKASQRNLRQESSLIDRVQSLGRQPGIVELWDAFLDHEPPCLVYQFIEGGDLTGLMRALKALPSKERETRTIDVMIALAGIIEPLHAMVPPIIHRDLKPANILISLTNGHYSFWVTDFGISALAADSALAGQMFGMSRGDLMGQSLRGTHTPIYASPEQINHAVPDPRDDVHALAVITYQLLVGDCTEKPGSDLEEVLKELCINGVLIQILKDALRTKREQRLLTSGIFAQRLKGLRVVSIQQHEAGKIAIAKEEAARQTAKLEEERRAAAAKAEAARQAVKLEEERRAAAAKAEAARQAVKLEEERHAAAARAEAARQAVKLEEEQRAAAKAEAARQAAKLEEERRAAAAKEKADRRIFAIGNGLIRPSIIDQPICAMLAMCLIGILTNSIGLYFYLFSDPFNKANDVNFIIRLLYCSIAASLVSWYFIVMSNRQYGNIIVGSILFLGSSYYLWWMNLAIFAWVIIVMSKKDTIRYYVLRQELINDKFNNFLLECGATKTEYALLKIGSWIMIFGPITVYVANEFCLVEAVMPNSQPDIFYFWTKLFQLLCIAGCIWCSFFQFIFVWKDDRMQCVGWGLILLTFSGGLAWFVTLPIAFVLYFSVYANKKCRSILDNFHSYMQIYENLDVSR